MAPSEPVASTSASLVRNPNTIIIRLRDVETQTPPCLVIPSSQTDHRQEVINEDIRINRQKNTENEAAALKSQA